MKERVDENHARAGMTVLWNLGVLTGSNARRSATSFHPGSCSTHIVDLAVSAHAVIMYYSTALSPYLTVSLDPKGGVCVLGCIFSVFANYCKRNLVLRSVAHFEKFWFVHF